MIIFNKLRSRINLTSLNIESNDVKRDAIAQLGKAIYDPSIAELKIGGNAYGRGKAFVKFSQLIGERVTRNVLSSISTTIVMNEKEDPIYWDNGIIIMIIQNVMVHQQCWIIIMVVFKVLTTTTTTINTNQIIKQQRR